ncbi:hypothetical protein [Hymenobacter perfusus]|uniref:Uncharacterized protein n=1 Tax=Hymenobacter perfusus TaxID=1236770 RepID=A0A3R9MRK6_9BACT|nr:hypothetical protein [Hymenobacter perfusus]RSK38994.1 hypothetical protein EI293_20955 [Hymenobacter perfusus]
MRYTLFLSIWMFCALGARAQTPYDSEGLIKYDYLTHKTDKPIPFDRSFTLTIEHLTVKDVLDVHAYESRYAHGRRQLVMTVIDPATGEGVTSKQKAVEEAQLTLEAKAKAADGVPLTAEEIKAAAKPARTLRAVKDVALTYHVTATGIDIFFPPLKPNKVFDIEIIQKFSPDNSTALLDVNALLQQSKTDPARVAEKKMEPVAKRKYDQLAGQVLNADLQRTALDFDYAEYSTFYQATLDTVYTRLSNPAKFDVAAPLTQAQIQAMGIAVKMAKLGFQRVGDGLELLAGTRYRDMQLGLLNATRLYQDQPTEMEYLHRRLQNLEANIAYCDSLQQLVDAAIVSGSTPVPVVLRSARQVVSDIRAGMRKNYGRLASGGKTIQSLIDKTDKILQSTTLVGGTVASDLKTAGGNVLFLDAGLTNIAVPNLRDELVYLPRLYWGVNIYFRPIDKNTRRNRFPKYFDPPLKTGGNDSQGYGPDYGFVTRNSVWQHLSLNLGFTLGTLPNSEFDNLYNNMSLLVGPAYRFRRAFKVSGGLALLKRTSKHPETSNKVVTPGMYLSLSTDIDFIQGLKDVTSLLFK